MASPSFPRSAFVLGGGLAVAVALFGCSSSDSATPAPITPPPPPPSAAHIDVALKDRFGQVLTADAVEPYSPRQTCGGCHDVDEIANGYHFQQGRTDIHGNIVVKPDYFKDGREFLRSAGMYGKW